ncbi:hypothetical protein [Hydrocarboniclastica marina]|uniref:hypothetical protein n=1 Tax=Hydrocarboniclastica marina TaxID=2259620 RepID=UPI001561C649|nr:hypothetical protein [Hydrocarboniclastica marina]
MSRVSMGGVLVYFGIRFALPPEQQVGVDVSFQDYLAIANTGLASQSVGSAFEF